MADKSTQLGGELVGLTDTDGDGVSALDVQLIDGGNPVGAQYPLSTDGDSLYKKDIKYLGLILVSVYKIAFFLRHL